MAWLQPSQLVFHCQPLHAHIILTDIFATFFLLSSSSLPCTTPPPTHMNFIVKFYTSSLPERNEQALDYILGKGKTTLDNSLAIFYITFIQFSFVLFCILWRYGTKTVYMQQDDIRGLKFVRDANKNNKMNLELRKSFKFILTRLLEHIVLYS